MSETCQNSDILNSKLETLNVNDSEEESDVIVTIRSDDVYEKIDKFLSDHNLVPDYAKDIFFDIHYQCSTPFRIGPEQLLFDEKMVDDILNNLDLSDIPTVTSPTL